MHMMFTKKVYKQMVERCKAIAIEFKQMVAEQRASFNPMKEDDIDCFGVSEEDIQSLFDKLKAELHVESELGFFRDNDEEYGRYCENNDFVSLPLCINYSPEGEIVRLAELGKDRGGGMWEVRWGSQEVRMKSGRRMECGFFALFCLFRRKKDINK